MPNPIFVAVASVAALAQAAQAVPKIGDTLACMSKDPQKRLFAVVGAIEPFGKGQTVAHITLLNETPGAVPPRIQHLPISLETLSASCPVIAATPRTLAAGFEDGRRQWLDAVPKGAGIFTITPDQIDDVAHAQLSGTTRP